MALTFSCYFFFFFNDTATTEIYTLSLHDALPIFWNTPRQHFHGVVEIFRGQVRVTHCHLQRRMAHEFVHSENGRSEEHTSELQSLAYLVCRLLLEKKKQTSTEKCDDQAATSPQLL